MPTEKTPVNATGKKRAARKPAATAARPAPAVASFVDPEKRAALIAQAAYFRAEKRGFAPGRETEDWLAAEQEVDDRLIRATPARV
jgi:hypothetical protein